MSSGQRRVRYNTRERAVSSDPNRAQDFAAAAAAEVLRYMFAATSEDNAAGTADAGGTVDSPTTAVVLNGLCARPASGTDVLLVDPGVVAMSDPDTAPSDDDSPWKVVVDPGVQNAGVLVLSPGGGSVRIDVVECKRTDVVLESDNRDVFSPASGLFTAVTVDKVVAGRLTYRIRSGTSGGGFPGTASGWLPLAVVQVNAGATTWDQCEVWDVRPLASDLARQPFDVDDGVATAGRRVGYCNSSAVISGIFESTLLGRRAGGKLALTTLTSSIVQEPGFAAVARRPWYLYAAFPFGLPRWAKYASSPSARVPLGFRGVPIFSVKGPADAGGLAGSALTVPTGTGLGGTTQDAAVVAAGYYNFATQFEGIVVGGGETLVAPGSGVGPSTGGSISGAPGPFDVTWSLVDNTQHPANAREVLALFSFSFTYPAGGSADGTAIFTVQEIDGLNPIWQRTYREHFREGAAFTLNIDFEMWIPLHALAPLDNATLRTRTIKAHVICSLATTTALDDAVLTIKGWRLGP
jgi:hypothetical protein